MAIFLNSDSKVIVQGMTGSEGRKHTHRMLAAGTQIVGGVTPVRVDRSSSLRGLGCRSSTRSVTQWRPTGANVTVIFVPAKFTFSAVVEAIRSGDPARGGDHRRACPVKDTAEFFRVCRRGARPD
jgi:succinyl-CoA synthetase alpha subunit